MNIKPFELNLGNGETVTIDILGPDRDLDVEPITLPDGTVLDNAAAEALSERICSEAAKRSGRPSLPAGQVRDTVMKVRVKPAAAKQFREVAKRRGLTVSEAMRDAMAEWSTMWPNER